MNFGALDPGIVYRWWAGQMAAMLRPLPSRFLPAPAAAFLAKAALAWKFPEIEIDRSSQRLSLLPPTADAAIRTFPLSPEGLGELAASAATWSRLFRRGPQPVRLVFPDMPVLSRHIRVPSAVRKDAASLVELEIDRITPFSADELIWSLSPVMTVQRDGAHEFRLHLTPGATIQPWLEELRSRGLKPVSLSADANPDSSRISLGSAEPAARHLRRLVPLLLVLLVIAIPFFLQSFREARIDAQLDALQPQRMLAQQLRSRLDALSNGLALIDRESRQLGSPLAVLASLTDALDDDTYLDSLMLKSGQLTFSGQSGDATKIIGRLEQTDVIKEPSFNGPVLHLPRSRQESFSIQASVGAPAHKVAGK